MRATENIYLSLAVRVLFSETDFTPCCHSFSSGKTKQTVVMVKVLSFPDQQHQERNRVLLCHRRPSGMKSCALPEANRILPGLYIGDFQLALKVLRSHDHMSVTHVLSMVSSRILSGFCKPCSGPQEPIVEVARHGSGLIRMVMPLEDVPDQDIVQVFQICFDFIDDARKRGGVVLVHCMAGQSRSASIIVAYLMKTLRLSLDQAMAMVNRDYKNANPNPGFMKQLSVFDKQLFENPSQVEGHMISHSDSICRI